MRRHRLTKYEFISILHEIQLHRGKYRHMLNMDSLEAPDSRTRITLKKLIKDLERAEEVEIRLK